MRYAFLLVLSAGLVVSADAQQFNLPITVTDGSATPVTITVGMHPDATDGYDEGLDAFVPPPPPTITSVYAKSSVGGVDFQTDLRGSTMSPTSFTISFDAPTVSDVTLSWSTTGLSALGTFELVDPFGTSLVDMTQVGSFSVSSSPFVQLGKSVTVVITPAPPPNSVPVAASGSETVIEDGSVPVTLVATDADGDALTFSVVNGPTHGTLSGSGADRTYTPNADFAGSDSFTFLANDGRDDSNVATVSLTVTPVNDPPVATADVVTGFEDTAATLSVLDNDYDVDGDALTITAISAPEHGSASIQGTAILYTPSAEYSGPDSFTYSISDGTLTATAAVSITVTAVNDAPVAGNDLASGDEDTPISVPVLDNDSDIDGGTLVVESVGPSVQGGSTSVNGTSVTYLGPSNFHGTDSFTYTVSDGNGGTDTGTVTVTVNPVNDPPVATDDVATATAGTGVTISPLTNDSDADGDALSLTAVGPPSHGSATDQGNGTILYTPGAGFGGQDSFPYTISDGQGGSATATVTISALTANGDALLVDEDTAGSIDPTLNDVNPGDGQLLVTGVGTPGHGTASATGNLITYTPLADFAGVDSFTYTVSDGAGNATQGLVSVTVTAINDPPVAVDDAVSGFQDTPLAISVLANDSDVDGPALRISGVGQPAHGSAQVDDSGTPSNPSDDVILYTPEPGYASDTSSPPGPDVFSYTLSDGLASSTASVSVTVSANSAPSAETDQLTVQEDSFGSLDPLANDSDINGEAIHLAEVGSASHGSTQIQGGLVVYTPDANYAGPDSFTYMVSDVRGASATGTVLVSVIEVNDAPEAADDVRMAFVGTSALFSPLENDRDVDGDDLLISAVAPGTRGTTAIVDGVRIRYTPEPGFAGEDSFTYTASDGAGLTDTATITVAVSPLPQDDDGAADSDEDGAPNGGDGNGDGVADSQQAHVTSVRSAASGTYITLEAEAGSELIAVQSMAAAPGNVPPPSDAFFPAGFLSYTLRGGPGNAARVVTLTLETGTFDSYYKFGPTPDNPEPHWYNFAFNGRTGAKIEGPRVTLHFVDGERGDDDLTRNGIIVDPGAPAVTSGSGISAVNDGTATQEDTAVPIRVLDNDFPSDGSVGIVSTSSPSHGTVSVSGGVITYLPELDYSGSDSFGYTIQSGSLSASATVSVTIAPVNDAPRFAGGGAVFNAPLASSDALVGGLSASGSTDALDIAFNPAADPEGSPVLYTWQLSTDAGLENILVAKTIAETSFTVSARDLAVIVGSELEAAVTVYHRMVASDGEAVAPSAIESFNLVRGYITATESEDLPQDFELYQNYPNPFNPVTTIRYDVPESGRVRLTVLDALGRQVAKLVDAPLAAGKHEVRFDASGLPSGVYIYVMRARGAMMARRLVVMR